MVIKGPQEGVYGDRSLLRPDPTDVGIRAILYYGFARCYHGKELGKGGKGTSLCCFLQLNVHL